MGRVVLTICRSCKPRRKWAGEDPASATGDVLYRAVKAVRKARGLKETFAVEEARCLDQCKAACAIELSGKKRPTYVRCNVDAVADASRVVEAAVAYAHLGPDERLDESALPGHRGRK
jgi:predicted metal-binding protein